MHNIKSPKYSMHFLLMSGLKGRDLAFFVAGTGEGVVWLMAFLNGRPVVVSRRG